jgi:hypothetical protein
VDNWNKIYQKVCISFDEMHEFVTLGPRLPALAKKYNLNEKKLRILHRKIFDASTEKNRQSDIENPGGMFIEAEGVGVWSFEKATVGVRRLLEGEDPETVAKEIGYSLPFLRKMEMNLVRHIMECTLELTFENPDNDFPILVKKWASGHDIEVDF